MIDKDVFVIDATVHSWSVLPENRLQPYVTTLVKLLYYAATEQFHPRDNAVYNLPYEQFERIMLYQPQLLESVMFAESDTDVALYHGTPLYGLFRDGGSPISVAEPIRERFPHRMFIYGDVSPWRPGALQRVDDLIDNHGVVGFKLYPLDLVDGVIHPVRLDDEDRLFPIVERARARGVKVIAVHKAVALPPATIDKYDVTDIAPIAKAFPDVFFEIVHGGFAFNREVAELLEKYPNVTVNLESSPGYVVNYPGRFAEMMAPLLATGAHDRIFFATGAPIAHPQPLLEAFWRFEMPRGYPRLTPEMKQGILGANFARQHRWDIEALKKKCAADRYGLRDKKKVEPWKVIRAAAH
jgi:uncharacterized protein